MICLILQLINLCLDCTLQSLHVRDIVRDSLEKDPVDRTSEDLEILLEFTQKLEAFNHMTMAVRRALCSGKEENIGLNRSSKEILDNKLTIEFLYSSTNDFRTIFHNSIVMNDKYNLPIILIGFLDC